MSRKHILASVDGSLRRLGTDYREEEREMIPLCRDLGVGVLPYSPLPAGCSPAAAPAAAAGPPRAALTIPWPMNSTAMMISRWWMRSPRWPRWPRSAGFRRPRSRWPGWPAGQEVAAPIVGVTRLTHLQDAVAALDVVLDHQEIPTLEAAYRPHRVLGLG